MWHGSFRQRSGSITQRSDQSCVANFKKIGKAFKNIRDQLRASEPALPVVQESAGQIESLASQVLSWFPPGSGPDAKVEESPEGDGKTNAKAEVWTQRPKFEEAQKRLYAEARKMKQVPQSGNKDALTAQFKALGAACKNCHNTFRNDD